MTQGVSFSKYFLWDIRTSDEEFLNTILHEIAHAIAGFEAGHGLQWASVAASIGCNARRCLDRVFTEGQWRVRCPCGAIDIDRHCVQKRLLAKVCRQCMKPLHAVPKRA